MTKLEKLLKYVSEHNEFYKTMIKDYKISNSTDIIQYPIVTKEVFQNHRKITLSDEYSVHHLTNRLYTMSSSGTSGFPVEILWEPSQYVSSMLCLWRRRKKYYNISPYHKRIDFMLKYYNSLPNGKLKYSIINNNIISVNRLSLNSEKPLSELFELMYKVQPVWLQLTPSVMEMIINYCLMHSANIPKSIRYVEFMSETLTPTIRKLTNELIPSAQIANMYGSEEMSTIAYECPCGRMHIISDNVFAECYDEKKVVSCGKGEIILTNLHNRVNPLIRYRQGDKVILNQQTQCECGYSDKIIGDLLGRVSSETTVNGKRLATGDISDIMLIVSNKYGNPISKYKFIYTKNTNILTCYTLFNDLFINWRLEIWNMIKSLFETKYGTINMEFVMDDYDKNNLKHDLFIIK